MDKAYNGSKLQETARTHNFSPVVPPKSNTVNPWEYDREMYKQRNKIERLFCRIKARFRKVFTRYDKFDLYTKHSSTSL